MCGIYGSTRAYDRNVIEQKMRHFKFRGPDFTGIKEYNYIGGQLVLAHNRLAIIDLSEKANQPMEYADGNIVAVLNGEIYNYKQLSYSLFSNTVFSTQSDTEILCALYEKFGYDCLRNINGDFSFVIYDKRKQVLFGAVDRMGDKPFYYSNENNGFEFCSQLLPLCIGNRYDTDEFARKCYFSMQYVPSPHSIVKQIRKLNPGEYFIYNLENNSLNIYHYWDLYTNSCGFIRPHSYEEALDTSEKLLDDAVKLRLNADVPVGVFLSGGIDSSAIAKFAYKYNTDIEAYSIAFNESDFDESYYAEEVARQIGIKYNKLLCSSKEAMNILDNLQYYYDEPMGDYSAIPTSLLCEKASSHIKVALGGDGGDEMFFGYPRYLRYANYSKLYWIPRPIRNVLSHVAKQMKKHRIADSLLLDNVQQLYLNRRPSNDSELFNPFEIQQSISQTEYLYENTDIRRAFNDFDIKSLMCHAYNVKLDRASMRSSLETRTPMLDYRIVEYSRLLPIEYCYSKQIGQKRILRDILYKDIDKRLFERKKQGFGVPLGQWFRNELKDYLCDTLNERTVGLLSDFDSKRLIMMRDNHICGKTNQTTLLWLCVNYISWYKLFCKQSL